MSDALRYYGDTLTSVTTTDLFLQIEAATGVEAITAHEITMICENSFTFKIGSSSWTNSVFEDADGKFKVSLTNVRISKVIIQENAKNIFIAILF